ncbi:MAG TPA: FixH family protein [Bacteroidales bacterium]|nr:FixH family protein [Bacteroidales bacterium]
MMKWNWGSKLVLAMILFIIMLAFFVLRMIREDVSLVERDYYPKSQEYDLNLEKTKNALPFKDDIILSTSQDQIFVHFPEFFRPGAVQGKVHFYNRASDKGDFETALFLNDSGTFVFPVHELRGRYILKMDWTQDGLGYYMEKTLTIEGKADL